IANWLQVCFLLLVHMLAEAGNPLDDMTKYFKNGDSKSLSSYFGSTVDLTLLDKEDVYSNSQAELMLRDFFSKHVPKTLQVLHSGDTQGTAFRIASLVTADGMKLRLSFHVKDANGKPIILEISIEKE
ncbi:MAG: DUF4783 domain-containing protein, partial [Flavobacteriales bacterium]